MPVEVQQPQVPAARWQELLGALGRDQDLIVDRVLNRLSERAGHRTTVKDQLRPGVRDAVGIVLAELVSGSDPATFPRRHAATFAQLGEARARQGATASDVVHGWRLCRDQVVARARELLPDTAESDRLLVRLYQELLGWLDLAVAASTEGHRAADIDRARTEHHAHGNLVRALFSGRLSTATLHHEAERLHLDPSTSYHAVRGRPGARLDAVRLEAYLLGPARGGHRNGVLALVEHDVCGFVHRLPTDPVAVPVGVGAPAGLAELAPGFRTATRMLEAALVLGRVGLIDVETLGLDAAVVTDEEVGAAMVRRYVRPLEAHGAVGVLILDTVGSYLANDGRLDTTARQLHVHANTVRYRLGRFEQLTQSSLRSNHTRVEVWWALRRRALRPMTPGHER